MSIMQFRIMHELFVLYNFNNTKPIPLVQFFAYKMTVASENSMLKHRNVNLNTVSLKASDCTVVLFTLSVRQSVLLVTSYRKTIN
jgi:hypothetical protein